MSRKSHKYRPDEAKEEVKWGTGTTGGILNSNFQSKY